MPYETDLTCNVIMGKRSSYVNFNYSPYDDRVHDISFNADKKSYPNIRYSMKTCTITSEYLGKGGGPMPQSYVNGD